MPFQPGLAAPGLILPMTIFLFGGQILPWLLLPVADVANIYVVSRTGEVLWRTNGVVNDAVLAQLYAQLDADMKTDAAKP